MHENVCEWFLALTILTYQSIHAAQLRSNISLLMDERALHIHIHFCLNPSSRHLQLISTSVCHVRHNLMRACTHYGQIAPFHQLSSVATILAKLWDGEQQPNWRATVS